ncbi:MAG: CRTAC1 family protein [bacterium]
MKAFLFLLALLVPAAPARPPADYVARRDFAEGAEAFRARFRADPTDAALARDLARLFAAWRRPDSSLAWWNRSLALDPSCDSATEGRWQALVRAAGDDSVVLAGARAAVAAEAAALLAETTAASLSLAWAGFALADTARAPAVAALLAGRFPGSPRGNELIGVMFYDSLYPVWTDDTLKVPVLRRFLARLPVTEWRATAYSFLLGSHYALGDTAGVLAAAAEMLADDPLDPFRARYAAAVLNRLAVRPESAAAWARRAVALEPGYPKPPNKPLPQWELEQPVLAASARIALAEALLALDSLDAAREQALAAVERSVYHADLEATPGPAWAILGLVEERRGDTTAAALACARALAAGDSRNQWAPRADSALARLRPGPTLTASRTELGYAGPVFTDVTDAYGLGAERGSRVAWGDYDGDGFEDLLVSGSRLYRNDSGVGFTDVTAAAGLEGARGRGGIWGDFDNDGRLDFFSSGSDSADRLWLNEGGRFRPVAVETGRPAPGEGCAAADFDGDGRLDLYVANYEDWAAHSYFPDRLYRNVGGALLDWTDSAGIVPPWNEDRAGRGVAWADFDDDGRPDCFVANYRLQENFLWWNRGDGGFENRAAELGVAGDEVDGWFGHTIGAAWADYDNDGDLDLFTADLAHPRYIEFSNRSRLYENAGAGAQPRFVDRRAAAGIRYEETHSNPAWADVDSDGDLDLYVTSVYEGRRSFLYENLGPGPDGRPVFRDVAWLSGTRAFNGWGCAFADFDNDGDLDLVVGSGSGLRLFRNDAPGTGNWLKVRVVGREANRAGVGCRVTVERGGNRQVREVAAGSGTTSQGSPVQHFGLGADPRPVTLRVRFRPGRETVIRDVGVNRLVTVEEPGR